MKHYTYNPQGICPIQIDYDIEEGKVYNLSFIGGCDGNHKGLSALVEGMEVEEVIKRLKGIECGNRKTSCPDQFAKSLEQI